jgi:hypothetical protein
MITHNPRIQVRWLPKPSVTYVDAAMRGAWAGTFDDARSVPAFAA